MTIIVDEPAELIVNLDNSTNPSCAGTMDGTATVSVTGGTGAYTYLWSDGQTTATATGLDEGDYDLTVTDANMCTATLLMVTITDPSGIMLNNTIVSDAQCNGNNGGVELFPSGGTPPFTYEWEVDAATGNSSIANGLPSADYEVTVTDANGCTISNSYFIDDTGLPEINDVNTVPTACDSEPDGCNYNGPIAFINEVMVNPFPDPFGANSQAMVNAAGTGQEWIEIYNPNYCDSLDLSCFLLGSLGQWGDIGSFAFPQGTMVGPLDFITIGGNMPHIEIKLFDYLGSANLVLNNPMQWSLENGDGAIALYNADGDVEDAVFWTATTQANPANYLANDSDYEGLPLITPVCGYENIPIAAEDMNLGNQINYAGAFGNQGRTLAREEDGGDWMNNQLPTIWNCNSFCAPPFVPGGDCDGSISLTVAGGVVPYTYDWNLDDIDGVANPTGLCAGQYTLTVTDANGCIALDTLIFVTQDEATSADFSSVQPSCTGNDGAINVTVFNPQGTITYTWSANANTGNSSSATGLSPGTYMVTVTDGLVPECPVELVITLNPPADLNLNPTAVNADCSNQNGQASVQASNGTSPYSYLWSANANTGNSATATGLIANIYSVTVTDANGCTASVDIPVNIDQVFTLSANVSDVECAGGDNGGINLSVNGASGALEYLWTNGATTQDLDSLLPGTYVVTVTEPSTGCVATETFIVDVGTILVVDAGADTTIVSGSQVVLDANPVFPDASYEWSEVAGVVGNNSSITLAPSITTTYTVLVTQGNCTVMDFVTVTVVEDGAVFIPNAFSPNADDKNDSFYPILEGNIELETFQVFNRWGQLLHDDPTARWDGTFKTQKQAQDVYVYRVVVRRVDGTLETLVGDLQLVR